MAEERDQQNKTIPPKENNSEQPQDNTLEQSQNHEPEQSKEQGAERKSEETITDQLNKGKQETRKNKKKSPKLGEKINEAGQQVTGQFLKNAWWSTLMTGGMSGMFSLGYIWFHMVARYIGGSQFFSKFGVAFTPIQIQTGKGTKQKIGLKSKDEKYVNKKSNNKGEADDSEEEKDESMNAMEIWEIITAIALLMLTIFVILGVLGLFALVAYMASHPWQTAQIGAKAVWDSVWDTFKGWFQSAPKK